MTWVPGWCWPWVGGLAAVTAEVCFRLWPHLPYHRHWVAILMALVVNVSVWKIMVSAPSLLAGFVSFSTATLVLRVGAGLVLLGESPTWRLALAVGLALAAKRLV